MLTQSQYLEGTELGKFLISLSILPVLGAKVTDHFTTINEFFQESNFQLNPEMQNEVPILAHNQTGY